MCQLQYAADSGCLRVLCRMGVQQLPPSRHSPVHDLLWCVGVAMTAAFDALAPAQGNNQYTIKLHYLVVRGKRGQCADWISRTGLMWLQQTLTRVSQTYWLLFLILILNTLIIGNKLLIYLCNHTVVAYGGKVDQSGSSCSCYVFSYRENEK